MPEEQLTPEQLRSMAARLMGSVRTPLKGKASRENGKLGGRPVVYESCSSGKPHRFRRGHCRFCGLTKRKLKLEAARKVATKPQWDWDLQELAEEEQNPIISAAMKPTSTHSKTANSRPEEKMGTENFVTSCKNDTGKELRYDWTAIEAAARNHGIEPQLLKDWTVKNILATLTAEELVHQYKTDMLLRDMAPSGRFREIE